MKRLFVVLSVALFAAALVSAGGTKEGQPAQKKVFTVGINNFGQANFFARIGRDAMIDEIQKNGGKVISSVTADVPSRVSAIENFISQKVDAIIIEEGDITQVAPPLVEAKKKGIIIGSMDSGDADFVDVFVESDNKQLGTKSAEKLMEYMGHKGKLVEIFNDAGSMIKVRKNALHDVVAQNPDVEIAFGFVYAWPDFLPDAKAKLEAILQAHPKPGWMFRRIRNLRRRRGCGGPGHPRTPDCRTTFPSPASDGDPEAYKEMRKADSPFKATLAQDPNTIARTVVDRVFDLLNGKKIEQRHIYVPGVLVTKENVPPEKSE